MFLKPVLSRFFLNAWCVAPGPANMPHLYKGPWLNGAPHRSGHAPKGEKTSAQAADLRRPTTSMRAGSRLSSERGVAWALGSSMARASGPGVTRGDASTIHPRPAQTPQVRSGAEDRIRLNQVKRHSAPMFAAAAAGFPGGDVRSSLQKSTEKVRCVCARRISSNEKSCAPCASEKCTVMGLANASTWFGGAMGSAGTRCAGSKANSTLATPAADIASSVVSIQTCRRASANKPCATSSRNGAWYCAMSADSASASCRNFSS